MTIEVKITCSGCDQDHTGAVPPPKYSLEANPDYVNVLLPRLEAAIPDDWWIYDPYTLTQYCPDCRKAVEEHRA